MHIYFSFKKINKNEIKKMGDGGAIDRGGNCPGGYCPRPTFKFHSEIKI